MVDLLLDGAIQMEQELGEFTYQLAEIYQEAAQLGKQDPKHVYRDFIRNIVDHFASKIEDEIIEWKPKKTLLNPQDNEEKKIVQPDYKKTNQP